MMKKIFPADYYLGLIQKLHDLMYLDTGYKINQSVTTYEPKHIENTQKHITEILKSLTKNELLGLETDMYVVRETCDT